MHPIFHSSLLSAIIAFIIGWIIISIPIWIASKFVSRDSSFPRAMLASLSGIIVFTIISIIFSGIAVALGLPIITIIGLLFAFLGVLGVFKVVFDTGWGGAFLIAVLAFVIVIVINLILAFLGFATIHFL